MAIFWKLFSLTKSPTLAFFSVAIVGLFLASSIQQSCGLECYKCLYDSGLEATDLAVAPYHPDCATLTPGPVPVPTEVCNDTSKYCVKKYVTLTYEDDQSKQNYMSRECSGEDTIPDLGGQALPVCFEVAGTMPVNTTVAPAKIIKKVNKVVKADTVQFTTLSKICLCNAKDKCNDGPGEQINETDGAMLTTTAPTDNPVEGTADPDIKEIGDGVGLVRPSLYFLVPAVPFFLASHVLRSMSAGANI